MFVKKPVCQSLLKIHVYFTKSSVDEISNHKQTAVNRRVRD